MPAKLFAPKGISKERSSRVKCGLYLVQVAYWCRTSEATLNRYEMDPLCIRSKDIRGRCDAVYLELDRFAKMFILGLPSPEAQDLATVVRSFASPLPLRASPQPKSARG